MEKRKSEEKRSGNQHLGHQNVKKNNNNNVFKPTKKNRLQLVTRTVRINSGNNLGKEKRNGEGYQRKKCIAAAINTS